MQHTLNTKILSFVENKRSFYISFVWFFLLIFNNV